MLQLSLSLSLSLLVFLSLMGCKVVQLKRDSKKCSFLSQNSMRDKGEWLLFVLKKMKKRVMKKNEFHIYNTSLV